VSRQYISSMCSVSSCVFTIPPHQALFLLLSYKGKSSPRYHKIPEIYLEYEEKDLNIYTLEYTEFQIFLPSEKNYIFFLSVISGKRNGSYEDCLRNLKLLRRSWKRCQLRDYNGLTSQDFILLRYVCVHS